MRALNKENNTIEAQSKPTLASSSQSKIQTRYNVSNKDAAATAATAAVGQEDQIEGKDID